MRTVVSVDGRITAAEEAVVPALDRGFLYGDSVYEVLWWHRGVAVLLNDRGEVTEATTANVYAVRAGSLATPPLAAGILRGTTRTRILALCARDGIGAVERTLHPSDLHGADEVFLSSSVRGVIPV